MKSIKAIIFLSIFITVGIKAQSIVKLGHINTQELLDAMPESDSAQLKVENETKKLQEELEVMSVEFRNKYQDYLSKEKTYSDLIKQTKQSELQDMQERIQQFQSTAEQELQKVRAEAFKPVLEKANKAISDVAKEQNYTYVFDISAGAVIYHSESSSNLLPLVKAKLGLQ